MQLSADLFRGLLSAFGLDCKNESRQDKYKVQKCYINFRSHASFPILVTISECNGWSLIIAMRQQIISSLRHLLDDITIYYLNVMFTIDKKIEIMQNDQNIGRCFSDLKDITILWNILSKWNDTKTCQYDINTLAI